METVMHLQAHESGQRLDIAISMESNLSRTRAQQMIRDGCVLVGGMMILKPSTPIEAGDEIEIRIPDVQSTDIEPEAIPLDILYQDTDIAVINKPCGMVVHPATGNQTGTVVNALLYHLDDLSGIGGEYRPGIVHRLDKDTSGLMVIAKNDMAHQTLGDQFKKRTTEKHYRAVVFGSFSEDNGLIDLPIGRSKTDRKKMAVTPDGKPAQTEWRVVERLRQSTLLDVHIMTGRTHQIRVHMKSKGHPVLGDVIYASGQKMPVQIPRLMLHSYSLRIAHPTTGEMMTFTAPLPDVFVDTVRKLRLS